MVRSNEKQNKQVTPTLDPQMDLEDVRSFLDSFGAENILKFGCVVFVVWLFDSIWGSD